MALFESYERRIDQINAALNKYGIKDIDEAKAMGDSYVSVEHLMLGLLEKPDEGAVYFDGHDLMQASSRNCVHTAKKSV